MNYLISVVNPGAMERVCEIAAALDLPQTVTLLGHGTAVQSMLDLLGIESTEKRVIMTVANPEKTRKFIKEMRRQVYIGIPGHGIIMAVPIKSVGGGKTLAYLNNGEQQPARYSPELSNRYELIVIVANEGRTDQVMNAARAAGATGGTVLHGKGTGSQNKKFYNVSIAAEKEVILMWRPATARLPLCSRCCTMPAPIATPAPCCSRCPSARSPASALWMKPQSKPSPISKKDPQQRVFFYFPY